MSGVLESGIAFPQVAIDREQSGLGSRMYRHARSILYGFMSISFLVGLRNCKDTGPGDISLFVLAMIPVFFIAVAIGFVQARAERERERERLGQEVRQKAEQATRELLRTWLDRCQDKISEDARRQLTERRDHFVDWYRAQVRPARERREAEDQRRAADAEAARRELPKAHDRVREVTRATEALAALEAALGGSG